ncbi:MAG TPA: hypothetical protein VNK24_05610 [Elusimicrobiota bacterium]|nr:hypothetical protein [Elusimicrobiota bacterium]HVC09592.1 hypothetical protein [Elusimicrobiota bacterium]
MHDGKWIQPRHMSQEVFEKDYPGLDLSGLDVHCPGCREILKLTRKSINGRIGAWCRRCNRGVGP